MTLDILSYFIYCHFFSLIILCVIFITVFMLCLSIVSFFFLSDSAVTHFLQCECHGNSVITMDSQRGNVSQSFLLTYKWA